jgi:hypothetical protein
LFVRKLAVLKKALLILFFASFYGAVAQKDTLPFNRKKEIIHDGKRYRVYNNYLTFGIGKAYSDIRRLEQNMLNVDFQFHVQKQYFQLGFFMSGDELLKNTNIQGHVCYGLRREKDYINLAAFVGPSYSYFVTGFSDSLGVFHVTRHNVFGGYLCLQGVYKIKYDVGLGIELFADVSVQQTMVGARLICYFSGAYRGEKKGFRAPKNSP